MDQHNRKVGIVGRLGVYPMVRLPLAARRILAYLAVRGEPVLRRRAAAELWPDVVDDVSRGNLRRALWQTPQEWVEIVGDEILLGAGSDMREARDAAARALEGEPLTLAEIDLLSNDILPGWNEEWLLPVQDSFRLLRTQALEAACRTMTAAGQHALAIQAGAASLAADPLRESAAEALIDAHLAQSNRYQAVQCFRLLAQRLDHELGVEPDPALAARVLTIDHPRRHSR